MYMYLENVIMDVDHGLMPLQYPYVLLTLAELPGCSSLIGLFELSLSTYALVSPVVQ